MNWSIKHTSMKKQMFNILLLVIPGCSIAQNGNPDNFQKMVDFLPPPPNAAAIIKHADLTINKNTGSPTFNIPLFTVKGRKLSTGISIGYSSTGLKVDEIASRAGMGWALNAGGVVTRTVRGTPDEYNTRVAPYTDPVIANCGNFNFMGNVYASQSCQGPGCNGYDAEPDLFNFNMNGFSGSFVYDANGQVVPFPVDKYKVEKDLNGTAWNFKITTTDGIIYYFGGTGAVEKTKRLSNCGKNFDSYVANSWYLKKIEHPNGETINFTYASHNYSYDNGVNETQYWAYWMIDNDAVGQGGAPVNNISCPSGECPPAPATTMCTNTVSTQGVLLSSVSCGNDIVNFAYQTRLDCSDMLVSFITHYRGSTVLESYHFYYNQQLSNPAYNNQSASGNNYTPYLTDLQRMSGDNMFTNTHRFVYNDPGGRPSRLSFSQDHWGYFNGKVNTTFIPKPTDLVLQGRFPNALANREPDPAFATKGMLTKIVYPTGGVDLVDYESNEVKDVINGPASYQTLHEYNCNVTGTGYTTENTKSTSFTVDQSQYVELTITCTTTNPGAYDTLHMKGGIEVSNGTTTYLYEYFIAGSPGIQYKRYLNSTYKLPAGTYTLTYKAKGSAQTTQVRMRYYPVTTPSSNTNKIVGGVRVKRVITGNPEEKPMIKRYYYANMETLNESSLNTIQWPRYDKSYRNTMNCTISNTGGGTSPWQSYCDLMAMYSGSIFNLFNYGSGLISYASVIESTGENFEGGAVQTKFYVGSDASGQVIWGDDMYSAPKSNSSSLLNGKVYEEIVYKKPASGSLFPIKKSQYTYLIDSRQMNTLYGYAVNKKYNIYLPLPPSNCPPGDMLVNSQLMNAFDMVKYSIYSWWVHPETVTETMYDENGQNPLITVTNSYYDNLSHLQLTRSESVNSKGETIKTTYTYPHDYSGNPVYAAMIAKNIIIPVITTKVENVVSGTPSELSFSRINYGDAGNNNYVPDSVEKSLKGTTPPDVEGTIDSYDTYGNILQFTDKTGLVNAIIWGYDHKYPVAKVTGASYATAVAQLTGSSVTALQTMDGATLRTELHRIRTNLSSAFVTSYTYAELIGVTSITDPNNKTNTYEYDAFGRLSVIRDQDGNAVKKNDYVYAGSNAASMPKIYYNDPIPKTYQCQTCVTGYIDNASNNYQVPAGKYYSLVSKDDANAQAQADNSGQEYVNKYGKCVNTVTANCTAPGYKVVNCSCELGQKICESSSPDANNPGAYFVHFHYLWSDGSTSPSFTEYITSCTGVDKKLINCVCETGVKECLSVTDNGGGSYTVTYRYRWSDNSVSSPSTTETITCSGPDKKMIGCTCETGLKMYLSQEFTTKWSNNGCPVDTWKCFYRYKWSDNTYSAVYYECNADPCIIE